MSAFIERILQKHVPSASFISDRSIGGGCINSTYQIKTDAGSYFLKWNRSSLLEMFETEKRGLNLLKQSPIHVPEVIGVGTFDDKSYLLTEWIAKGSPSKDFWTDFGRDLAIQHRLSADFFGLDHDNFIGNLTQQNSRNKSWSEFFISERLKPQLAIGVRNGLIDLKVQNDFDRLFEKLDHLIPREPPSLLHGDLWSGNFMINSAGQASIFDPAVYYGHRETELAFTQLFGGFDQQFYDAYPNEFPLEPGFEDRVDLHNLYPLLVHVNLFGSSYLSGILQTLKRFT